MEVRGIGATDSCEARTVVKATRPGWIRAAVGGVRRRALAGAVSCSAGRRRPCPPAPRRRRSPRSGRWRTSSRSPSARTRSDRPTTPACATTWRAPRTPRPEGRDPVHRGAPRHDDRAHGARREHPGAHRRHRQHGRRAAGLALRLGAGSAGRGRRRFGRGGDPRGRAGAQGRARPRATTSSCCSPTPRSSACSAPGRSSSSTRGRRTSAW